jgi:hypothetical protein
MCNSKRTFASACLGVLLALGMLASLASCDNNLVVSQFVPWYASLIKKSIDYSDYLPVAYRNQPITIQKLTGPDSTDPTNPAKSKSWIIFAQQRSPEPSEIVVMDTSLNVVYSTTNNTISTTTNQWMVDLNGNILLGGLTIIPPGVSSSTWKDSISSPNYLNFSEPWIEMDTSHIRTQLSLSGEDLYFGDLATNLYKDDTDWNTLINITSPAIYYSFGTTYWPALFGKPYVAPTFCNFYCLKAEQDVALNLIRLFVVLNCSDGTSPPFVITFPNMDPNSISGFVTVTVLNSNSTGNTNTYNNYSDLQFATLPDGSYLTILQKYDNNGSTYIPLAHNLANGSLARQIEVASPAYTSSNGNSFSSSGSSIGQQPFHLANENYWLAVDGFTQKLHICAPWWE